MLSLLLAVPSILLLGPILLVTGPLLLLSWVACTTGATLVRALSRPGRLLATRRPQPQPLPLDGRTDALNAALAGVWPALTASVQASATSALAAALPPLPPPHAWALSRTRLRLAGPPPALDRFVIASPATQSGGGAGLAAEASVTWAGSVEIGLELVNRGGRPRRPALSVGAAVEGVRADLVCSVLSFSPGPPTPSATLRLSLPRPPDLSISTWVGNPLSAGFLPVLDAFVEGAVREALCGPLLAPGGAEVSWPPGSGGQAAARGRGVVVVDLVAGVDLPTSTCIGPVVAVVSVPGGRAVGGGGTAAVAGRASRRAAGSTSASLDFSSAPPAVFSVAPDAQGLRIRVALYGMAGGAPLALGSGEREATGEEVEAAMSIPLCKAGPPLTPRTRAATTASGSPALAHPRLIVRLTVGWPEVGGVATHAPPPPNHPGGDWLGGGVLRVGLGAPPPAPPSGPPLALVRLVEVSASGRSARLWGGGNGWGEGGTRAVDLAFPASAIAGAACLMVAASDWVWAADAGAPLTFTRPGPGRTEPARVGLPLARLVSAPGGHTAGVFRLSGCPPGVPAAVALKLRWVAFRGG